jgi:PAS domain S-box-containing protein
MRSSQVAKKKSVSERLPIDSEIKARELEQELRERIERYDLLFKATNDVVYDLDIIKALVTWNDALYTQYGYNRHEPAHTVEWWTQSIHPEDALRVEAAVSALLESNENTWTLEYRFRKADGSYVNIRDRAFVHRNENGEPLRIIGSFLDITESVKLDQAKDEFISLVSHQLRTPLTIIRFHSEMLLGGSAGTLMPNQTKQIKNIADASVRLIKLVGDILTISRATLDRMNLDIEPADANNLIKIHIDELMPLAEKKGTEIIFRPDNKIGLLPIDKMVFGQILHNYLTNAIRYTRPGEGRIVVCFTKVVDGYVISVNDNGIGIPRAARPHIFSRLFRAENTANFEEHGSGLGLYLVKLMADSFGGKAWFETKISKGSTFFIFIPLYGMGRIGEQ